MGLERVEHGVPDVLLAGVVLVQGGFPQAERLRELSHVRPLIAALREHDERLVEYPLLRVFCHCAPLANLGERTVTLVYSERAVTFAAPTVSDSGSELRHEREDSMIFVAHAHPTQIRATR